MRKSGESGQTATTERVKVAMQVPKGANISEWKEETRTPTPVTIMEEGPGEEESRSVHQDRAVKNEDREKAIDVRQETGDNAQGQDSAWRRGIGSV